jgi:hypothetical protein
MTLKCSFCAGTGHEFATCKSYKELKTFANKLGLGAELAAAVRASQRFQESHVNEALKASTTNEKNPMQFVVDASSPEELEFLQVKMQEERARLPL